MGALGEPPWVKITSAVNVALAPTRIGAVVETYGGVRLPLSRQPVGRGLHVAASPDSRKLVDAPSSRTTARARLSASVALEPAGPGRSTSVRWMSGLVPCARPTSPKLFVENVLLIVKSPVGR